MRLCQCAGRNDLLRHRGRYQEAYRREECQLADGEHPQQDTRHDGHCRGCRVATDA